MMEWIYVVMAVVYILVGVLTCWHVKTRGALEVVTVVLFWPFLYVASVVYVLVAGLTSRR